MSKYSPTPIAPSNKYWVWLLFWLIFGYRGDGSKWDALGEVLQIESITNAEIDTITEG